MKLTTDQTAAVQRQTGADPLPEDNPTMGQLQEIFGEHTFYVAEQGLVVPETTPEETAPEAAEDGSVEFMLVAVWAGEDKQSLQPIEPQPTGIKLELATAH
ncbi:MULTISPECIES: hypothetical protein [Thalassobaculum]|uniref:Uncharacterized protein n=1 Tax=Thalassobaculum litoreum DSM 18839 TaxID=1123362 RepID=A0A8G2BGC6_9PROT|nr:MULTISPECIES: hypothetical protein [Thalassobaculum]SDF53731.1 hypothetical protein SAMN05660686_01583 [Thalassobaculum litoreum DSM 18839]